MIAAEGSPQWRDSGHQRIAIVPRPLGPLPHRGCDPG